MEMGAIRSDPIDMNIGMITLRQCSSFTEMLIQRLSEYRATMRANQEQQWIFQQHLARLVQSDASPPYVAKPRLMPPAAHFSYRVATAGVLLAWLEMDALVCVSDGYLRRVIRVPTTADQSSGRFSGGRVWR